MLILTSLGVAASGCDTQNFVDYEPEIVVESYLIAGEDIPVVRLSWSASTRVGYDFENRAISDATVTVSLLDENGAVEYVMGFETFAAEPGVYWPVDDMPVRAGRTYRLDATAPNVFEPVTATTLVPGAFELVRASADTLKYQGTEQFELDVTKSFYPGRQSIYVFATESLDPRADMMTPFYRDVVGDSDEDVEDLRITESPIINEGNYDVNEDGTLTIKLPWLAVAFFGPNRLTANALDDNLYDFIRSQSIQQGGSTLSPGEIPNVIEHVDGGTGIFGSLSRSSYEVFISR